MKIIRFVGSSRQDLASFPDSIRRRLGQDLYMLQVGREPGDFKPLPSVGSGAFEIRARGESGAFRVIYVAKLEKAVYVLHAFQKKSQKTQLKDIELAARRYRNIEELT
jgi:phage-related protein